MKKISQSIITKRVLWTLFFLFIYCLGNQLVLPFVDLKNANIFGGAIGSLAFSSAMMGGNLRSMSLFSVGLSPWMSAMILWQMFSFSKKMGQLLETYGTYESNGIAFSDTEEIWWLETIGGHHWIARRVPDDAYVTNPNQLGIDHYEFENPDDYLASPDIRDFINKHHLDLTYSNEHFNPRYAFGSQRDKDRHYNTPRAWAMQKFLNPEKDYDPKSFFIPWCQKPYRKITVEDVKYVLSLHYQDTPYDPYGPQGDAVSQRQFRPIGINRTSQTALLQMRPNKPSETTGIQWLAYGSMPFGTMVPFWTQVGTTPAYFRQTTDKVDTGNFYWSNRLIAAICDPHFQQHEADLDAYVETTMALGHAMINHVDTALANDESIDFEAENQKISDKIQSETDKLLAKVLDDASNLMTNRFSMSD